MRLGFDTLVVVVVFVGDYECWRGSGPGRELCGWRRSIEPLHFVGRGWCVVILRRRVDRCAENWTDVGRTSVW